MLQKERDKMVYNGSKNMGTTQNHIKNIEALPEFKNQVKA